jgi:hypothetical protein
VDRTDVQDYRPQSPGRLASETRKIIAANGAPAAVMNKETKKRNKETLFL